MDNVLSKWQQLEQKVPEYQVLCNENQLGRFSFGERNERGAVVEIKFPLSQAGKACIDAGDDSKDEAGSASYPSLIFYVEAMEQGHAFLTSLLVEFWSAGEGATGLYPMLITPKTTVAFLHSWFDNCIEPFSVEAEFVQPAHDAIELYVKMAREILSLND